KLVAAMKSDPRKVLLGRERLEKLNMKVGDKFKLYSMNYKGIDLEFEIAGELRSEEHTSELQSRGHLVCRLLLEKKKKKVENVIHQQTKNQHTNTLSSHKHTITPNVKNKYRQPTRYQ